jgi:hypothetical protein
MRAFRSVRAISQIRVWARNRVKAALLTDHRQTAHSGHDAART